MVGEYRSQQRWVQWGSIVALVLVGLAVFWPTLSYNFFWEDPFDIGQVDAYSYGELLTAPNSNSYYRPLALTALKALKFGDEVYSPAPFHAFVITGHLLAALMLYQLARYLFRDNAYALSAGLIFILTPVHFEATARASSMHHWLVAGMLGSFWLYAFGRTSGRRWPLLAALLIMGFAQTLHENGLLFPGLVLLLELWLLWQQRVARFSPWALVYFLPAIIYFAVWLAIPKTGEPPQFGIHLREALFLSQGLSFPLAGPFAWLGGFGLTPAAQAGHALVLSLLLLISAHGRDGARRLALALGWWVAASSLAWLARPLEYLEVSPRVMYFPSFGAALAWAGLIRAGKDWLHPIALRQSVRVAAVGALIAVSVLPLRRAIALYQRGSDLMDAIVARGANTAEGEQLLFVNVPDRFETRTPFYPLGYWGMLLAPVSQDLSDFITFATGTTVETRSLSDFQLLAAEVDSSPYRVNTRGIDAHASETIYEAALWSEAVFITRYRPDGALSLEERGTIFRDAELAPVLARYEGLGHLSAATATLAAANRVEVRLDWHAQGAGKPNDIVFVHLVNVNGELAAQSDSDSIGGLIPLSAWRRDDFILDIHLLETAEPLPAGEYQIFVGIYNRVSGERVRASAAEGSRANNDAVRVATLTVP